MGWKDALGIKEDKDITAKQKKEAEERLLKAGKGVVRGKGLLGGKFNDEETKELMNKRK